jgi:nucleoid-associated protein YgaU
MKRSGAIWLVVGVVAVAALLMYLVVLPQIRDGRAVEELAKKAEQAVKDVKQTVNDAAQQVEDVADGAQQTKATALAKVARFSQDARGAADEMKALLEKGTPSPAELAAAKTKLAGVLKSASELKLPVDADLAATAAAARIADGAKAALTALENLPTDPTAAKAALVDIEAKIMSALSGEAATEATEQSTENSAVPAFDILRVEKDGSTVIAGRSQPGAQVDVMDGDTVLATTKADTSGDFAAVLENPLPAGDHSIVLKSTATDGQSSTSEEVATVSVPKDGSGELLAMVTKPGEASKIITAPEGAQSEVASNKGVTTDAAGNAIPELPSQAPDIASTPPAVAGEEQANGEQAQTANADPAAAHNATETTDAGNAPEVLVSAVELEGDKIFVAGSTRPKATVRIYADDKVVAEARADGTGRFVADGVIKLAIGNHTIRADVLSADGAKVEYRASVPFFRPEGDVAAVASSDPSKSGVEPIANGAFDKAREEAGKAMGLLHGLYEDNKIPSQEELTAARSSAEIALKSLAEIRVAGDIDPAAADLARKASDDAGKALAKLKAVPTDVAAFGKALGDVEATVRFALKPVIEVASAGDTPKLEGEVSAADVNVTEKVDRLAQPADEAQPVAKVEEAAKPAEASSPETASADGPKVINQAPLTESAESVIIRRGDTLWQISRRVYGKGVRYTTIYMANQAQIEDPDRIKPGQIFSMPGKYLDNAEELHKERLSHDHPRD